MDESAYRKSAPPPPRIFRLEMSPAAMIGLCCAIASLLIALFVFLVTRGGLMTVFFLGAPGFFYFLLGAPRSIEVHHDRIVLRYWLRGAKTHAGSEVIVQKMPDELILIDGKTTHAIPADAFPDDSFAECTDALRAVASRFDERLPLR